jgi:hypothetical protein
VVFAISSVPNSLSASNQTTTKAEKRLVMSENGVLTGTFFINGDVACAEGAISAGCRFFAGYPITPATEVAERMSERLPHVGGVYIQMEDEIASMNAILGASWTGMKSMTSTSGPGFSLMMETRLQPDDGESGSGGNAGNSLCDCKYTACRSIYGIAYTYRAG